MTNKMSCSIFIINIELFWKTEKGLTLLGLVVVSTHSSMFQCNWDFQSFHHILDTKSLFLIRSCLLCDFLPSFVLFSDGSPFLHFSKYHPPPISVINFWFFFLELVVFQHFEVSFWTSRPLQLYKTHFEKNNYDENCGAICQ